MAKGTNPKSGKVNAPNEEQVILTSKDGKRTVRVPASRYEKHKANYFADGLRLATSNEIKATHEVEIIPPQENKEVQEKGI